MEMQSPLKTNVYISNNHVSLPSFTVEDFNTVSSPLLAAEDSDNELHGKNRFPQCGLPTTPPSHEEVGIVSSVTMSYTKWSS